MRRARVALGAVLAITLFSQVTPIKARPSPPTVTLHMEGWVVSKANQAELDSLLAQFQKTHKRIKVVFSTVQGDFESQLEAQFLSHSAPDVFEIDAGWARDFIQAGVVARLDGYAYKDKSYHPSDFGYKLLDQVSYRGKVYAYPFGFTTLGLWYSKNQLRALHIKHPPTDWRSFARIACELTDKKKHVFGAVLSPDPSRWFAFLKAFGGRVLNGKGNGSAIASKQSNKALEWYAGLVRKGCAEEPPAGSSDTQEFGSGHAAMMFETSDTGTVLRASYPHLAWGNSKLPTGPKGNSNLAFVDGFAMNAQSKQKAAAWKLIAYLTSKSATNAMDAESGYLPARSSVRPARSLSAFVRGAAYALSWAWPPGLVVNAFPQISADVNRAATRQESYKNAVADMALWLKRYL